MAQIPSPVTAAVTGAVSTTPSNFICLTGTVVRAEPIGFIQRGTHRLIDISGNVIAALRSTLVNLNNLEGRFVTVCGINEGQIEGVTSLLVTQVLSPITPTPPPVQQFDLRTLLLILLLTQPNVFRTRPDLLQLLLLTGVFGGLGGAFGLWGVGTGFGGLGGLGTGLGGLGTGLGGLGTGLGGLGTGGVI